MLVASALVAASAVSAGAANAMMNASADSALPRKKREMSMSGLQCCRPTTNGWIENLGYQSISQYCTRVSDRTLNRLVTLLFMLGVIFLNVLTLRGKAPKGVRYV